MSRIQEFTDGQTVIESSFLNAIQDKIDEQNTNIAGLESNYTTQLNNHKTTVNNALAGQQTAFNTAMGVHEANVNAAIQAHKSEVNEAIGSFESGVSSAVATINNTVASFEAEVSDEVAQHKSTIDTELLQYGVNLEFDNEEKLLYLVNSQGERIGDGIAVATGGGGGGGGGGGEINNAVLTVTNLSGFLAKTVAEGADCEVSLTWSSIENETPTGSGTLAVIANGVTKLTRQIEQGPFTLNLSNYCVSGSNTCRVRITDIYGNARSINFNITITKIAIESSFDTSTPYQGTIVFDYTPIGALEKTIYFVLDGSTIGTTVTKVNNRQMSYTIPAQSHGEHTLKVYFTAEVNGETVTSNVLYYEFMATTSSGTAVLITSPFNTTAVDQYTSVVIPFRVYDPANNEASVSLYVNNELVSTQTVDRTEQQFTVRATEAGYDAFTGSAFVSGETYYERSGNEGSYVYTKTQDTSYNSSKTYYTMRKTAFSISSGQKVKIISFYVNPVQIDAVAETENLALYLTAQGRSNNEATKNVWQYYPKTKDLTKQSGKTYYTRSGTAPNYTYTAFTGNSFAANTDYYESPISATFTDFTWTLDGWQTDSDGINVMRLVDDARVTIPYKIFENDFKSSGKTIEIEFATRAVSNYNAVILSCLDQTPFYNYTLFTGESFETGVTYYEFNSNAGTYSATSDNSPQQGKEYYTRSERRIGMKITSQEIMFDGAQTEIGTVYKDNEHVRLSIVVQKQSEYRLILIYINGIMSRAIQYASGERFSQLNASNITIGSSECGIDIYNIRVYDNSLNRLQILDNWIVDTQVGELMFERYRHNQVYNQYGEITTAKLPTDLPYFIVECERLPQYKGDKLTCSGSFVDPSDPSKSFTFTGCQINVQGTSSAIYYRKNYDMQFKQGFIMTATGETESSYGIFNGSIPFNRFVLKADVASSESANNTELTMFYNDSCPYRTPAMVANSKVRYGIEGRPCVLFWYNTDNQTTSFMGKYNFNLPKRAPGPYGYGDDSSLESWEVERNNSQNVKFQDDDFTSMTVDALTGESYPTWYDDFEARFPSDEWRDYSKIKEFLSWVKSTWREDATNENLSESVSYRLNTTTTLSAYSSDTSYTVVDEEVDGTATGYKIITFTKDTPAYRLTKFRAEASQYMEIDSALFYYLFTELFLMIDSRAKNMFLGFDGSSIT